MSKEPGDKGYGYFVRKAVESAPWERIPSQKVSGGKSIGGKGFRQVMEKLAQHANNESGTTWVSAKKIASEIGGMHRDMVGLVLKMTEEWGWIEVVGKRGRSKERLVKPGFIPETFESNEEEEEVNIDPQIIEERARAERRKARDAERARERTATAPAEPQEAPRLQRVKRYVPVHRAESMHPQDYELVEVSLTAERAIEAAKRHTEERRAAERTTTVVRRYRTGPGPTDWATKTIAYDDPDGRIAAAEERRRAIERGEYPNSGGAWDRIAPDFD